MPRIYLLPLLLAVTAGVPVLAQTPAATVKTKVKPAGGRPSPKTKTTVTASAVAPAADADAPATPNLEAANARANALTASMAQGLGLTPQQTEKVRAVNLNSVRSVEAARVRYRTDPRKMLGQIDAISQSRLEALKDVLSPAQFDRYQRKREEKMGIPNVQGNQGTPPPGLGGNE